MPFGLTSKIDWDKIQGTIQEQVVVWLLGVVGTGFVVVSAVTPLGPQGATVIAKFVRGIDESSLATAIRATSVLAGVGVLVLIMSVVWLNRKKVAYREAFYFGCSSAETLKALFCTPTLVKKKVFKAYVGKTAAGDRLSCAYSLQPDQGRPIRAWKMRAWCTSEYLPRAGTSGGPLINSDDGGAVSLLVSSDPKNLEWLFVFQNAIESKREVQFEMTYPGFWNQLRRHGEDVFEYRKGELEILDNDTTYDITIFIPVDLGTFQWKEAEFGPDVELKSSIDASTKNNVLTLKARKRPALSHTIVKLRGDD
jgi:hypothetical protein